MAKTHFKISTASRDSGAVCGRASRFVSDQVNRVTCLNCKKQPEFVDAQATALARETERFMAQEPRRIAEPWKDGVITCDVCLGDLFREANRTCYGHYANYVCAGCGSNQSRLTETGMSF